MVTTYLLRVTSGKKARKPLRYKKAANDKYLNIFRSMSGDGLALISRMNG